jgi:hypothetical protein
MSIQYHALPPSPPLLSATNNPTAPPIPPSQKLKYYHRQYSNDSTLLSLSKICQAINRIWFSELKIYILIIAILLVTVTIGIGAYFGIRRLKKQSMMAREAGNEAHRPIQRQAGTSQVRALRTSSEERRASYGTTGGEETGAGVGGVYNPLRNSYRFSDEDLDRLSEGEGAVLEGKGERGGKARSLGGGGGEGVE